MLGVGDTDRLPARELVVLAGVHVGLTAPRRAVESKPTWLNVSEITGSESETRLVGGRM